MTDYKALCAELTDELHGYASANPYHDSDELVARARAALAAEPVTPDEGEVAELVVLIREGVAQCVEDFPKEAAMMTRAANLLSCLAPQPVPKGPSDEELDDLAWNWYSKTGSTWYQIQGFRAFARAALARWGRPAPVPVPPTDEELISPIMWMLEQCVYDNDKGEIVQSLRELIARWGRPVPQPQPVPEPERPSTEELHQVFLDHAGYIDDEQVLWSGRFCVAARAVLARWGN